MAVTSVAMAPSSISCNSLEVGAVDPCSVSSSDLMTAVSPRTVREPVAVVKLQGPRRVPPWPPTCVDQKCFKNPWKLLWEPHTHWGKEESMQTDRGSAELSYRDPSDMASLIPSGWESLRHPVKQIDPLH